MGLYTNEGWLNFDFIMSLKTPFIYVVGGRGIGKTYGGLEYVLKNDITFMLTRRTEKQQDMISDPLLSPLKKPCKALELSYDVQLIEKNISGIYVNDDFKGFGVSLYTMSSIRGFDAGDVKIWLYDEFIPERHEKRMKGEGRAYLNAYETINRNRELEGEPPLKSICMSNSEDIGNPIFAEMHLIGVAEKMQAKGQEVYINGERGITVLLPNKSPISEAKKQTALYKALPKDSTYLSMSLENDFELEPCIDPQRLSEYKIVVSVGDVNIYEHKSDSCMYYISSHYSGTCERYATDATSLMHFKTAYKYILTAYMVDRVKFESIQIKRNFEKYFGMTP